MDTIRTTALIYNPAPIAERLPKKTKDQIAVAVAAGITHKTLLHVCKGTGNVTVKSLAGVIRATNTPYAEVFDAEFFEENQN